MEEPDSCQAILSVPDCSKDHIEISSAAESLMMDGECQMISSTVDRLGMDEEQLVISAASSALAMGSDLEKSVMSSGGEELALMEPAGNTVIAIQQDVDSKLELNQYIPVEVFDTANVIEIDTASENTVSEGQTLPEYSYLTLNLNNKEEVPDMVAAETVVTTSQPRRRKQNLASQNILTEVSVVENDLTVGDTADSSGWTLQVDGLYLDQHPTSSSSMSMDTQHVVEVLTSEDNSGYVAVAPDTTTVDIPVSMTTLDMPTVTMSAADVAGMHKTLANVDKSTFEASIRALTKRQRDRLKKRELRMNPDFRLKEKDKSRERMRLRRQDPDYRELERERDRIRRWQSRRRNDMSRQKERERDKQYKRVHRKIPKIASGSATQVEVTSYNIDISDINSVDL